MNYHETKKELVVRELNSNSEQGLSEKQAQERLLIYGRNKLAEQKKRNLFIRFLSQFNDFMVLILLLAAAVSVVISLLQGEHDFIDAIIILAIVCLNAILGIVQESKAEKALDALKKLSSPKSTVIRGGSLIDVDSELIVPGDIILLESGDYISADARLINSYNLKVEESALTGESFPAEKDAETISEGHTAIGDRVNMVFSGSSVCIGRGRAIVTKTGMETVVGKIAKNIIESETPETPLQKKLDNTGKILGIIALCICGIVFITGIIKQFDPFEMFMTSVSLAVAAIPEGLPSIVTIMLALGVTKMAKHNAIVRKLPAVESLGQATIICSDKTGTLTQNKMKVVEVSDGFRKLPKISEHSSFLLKLSCLCTDCVFEGEKIIGDPTETAIVNSAASIGLLKDRLEKEYIRVSEIPFDSSRKLMTTVHKNGHELFSVTKGAPDVLLNCCTGIYKNGNAVPLTDSDKKQILAENARMASDALRVIASAYKHPEFEQVNSNQESGLTFLGLIAMVDPPRPEAFDAVKTCKRAGIKPVMITGDHVLTAQAIARQLGILNTNDQVMTGIELNNISKEDLPDRIENVSVFARVTPEHKMNIVEAYQQKGHIVAMTGDGVNDAPALKKSDIGCAMGISGTDVAKSAADIILTDDNFSTIIYAVREGRGIFTNVKKSVHFLLSSNIGEIISIFAAILIGWNSPLLAIHLLWVNLVTDSLPAIALGLDPCDSNVMTKKPQRHEKSLFTDGLWQKIVFQGMMIGMLTLIAFAFGMLFFDKPGSIVIGRTMAFATLSISQLVHAFNMRSEGSIFAVNMLGNPYLIGAFIVGIVLQCSVIMIKPIADIFSVVQLDYLPWIIVALLSILPLVIVEIEKWFEMQSSKREKHKRFQASV